MGEDKAIAERAKKWRAYYTPVSPASTHYTNESARVTVLAEVARIAISWPHWTSRSGTLMCSVPPRPHSPCQVASDPRKLSTDPAAGVAGLMKTGLGLVCPFCADFGQVFSCWFRALIHVTGTGRSQHRSLFLLRGGAQVFIEPLFDILCSNGLQSLAKEFRCQGGDQQRNHQHIRRDLPARRSAARSLYLPNNDSSTSVLPRYFCLTGTLRLPSAQTTVPVLEMLSRCRQVGFLLPGGA